jgi:hypothetical protein
MTTRRAACNCGKLEIVCEGEPVRISMCHCLECQRRTGAVFGSQAWFTQQQTTVSGQLDPIHSPLGRRPLGVVSVLPHMRIDCVLASGGISDRRPTTWRR